jgi:hypothetical protein
VRRRLVRLLIAAPVALIVVGAAAALSVPTVRHIVSGLWHLPDRLPALSANGQVHYQPGAEDFAREVAALLPDAIARVEAEHGRAFAHPVTVAVYATMPAYAAANGIDSTSAVGVTFAGRVYLSPVVFQRQQQRLGAILTHELSHALLQGWIGQIAYMRLPTWFKEGSAVMVSGGGGDELVSEQEAWAAIARGEQIDIDEAGSLTNPGGGLRADGVPADKPLWYPVVLAYREAGMFVTYLRYSDRPAFDRMMNAIFAGRTFAQAMTIGYHDDARSLWRKFVASNADRK